MVCLGPRKKEKKNEANTRGVKKQNAKSKNAKTSISPSPSVRNQLNEKNKNDSHDASLLNERAPSPNPQKAPVSRQTSIISTTRTIASRAASNASSLRRFPISEMKEEFKGLKLKNDENLKLIADQKAELEELKQQLEEQSNDKSVTDLKEREEQLLLYEKEIEQLKVRLQNESPTPESEQKAEILAEKEKELQEKEAKLKEQERIMDEKVPEIEHVAMQLEELKIQNQQAVQQLAEKEKELEELRQVIKGGQGKEYNSDALQKIEELNKQLELQKKAHEDSLKLHEKILAEKNKLLKEQKTALDSLQENHRQELMELKATQTESIAALKRKHQQDKIEMETILEKTQKEAAENPRKEAEEQLERILQDFEQAEHTFTVQIKDLEQSHQSELDHLQDDQKAQMKKLKSSQNMSRNSWTERYLPTDAVSWPQPHHNPKLKPVAPVSLVESKSKTLMRVLGNTTTKSQPVLTPIDNTKVQIYYSSVSTSVTVKRNQTQMQRLLSNKGISYGLVDVAQSEEARQYAKKCNNNGSNFGRIKDFPQVFVGGEYRGQCVDLMNAIDDNVLDMFLRPAEKRQFTQEEKESIQKAESNDRIISPTVVKPVKTTSKPVRVLKDNDEDEDLFKELELEFSSGKINMDDFL